MNKIIILGAGGHGRVAADIARLCCYDEILFLDDADISGTAGKIADHMKFAEEADFFVAIGNNATRREFQQMLQKNGCNVISLIHPNAVLGSNVCIGAGTVIMAGVIVNTGAFIGSGVILNTACSVDHDCRIGDFSHVSVGAHLAGTVTLGNQVLVGAGATIINNMTVTDDCVIGAGAVVIRDIDIKGTYVGVPAKKI